MMLEECPNPSDSPKVDSPFLELNSRFDALQIPAKPGGS